MKKSPMDIHIMKHITINTIMIMIMVAIYYINDRHIEEEVL